jgi:hypothetical protein
MSACTRLPFDSRAPSAPDESLAVLIRGHEVAPRTQTDDSHDAIIDIDWLVGNVEHHLNPRKGFLNRRRGARLTLSAVTDAPTADRAAGLPLRPSSEPHKRIRAHAEQATCRVVGPDRDYFGIARVDLRSGNCGGVMGGSYGSVAAGATTVITFPGVVHMASNVLTSCQDVLATIPVTVTGQL